LLSYAAALRPSSVSELSAVSAGCGTRSAFDADFFGAAFFAAGFLTGSATACGPDSSPAGLHPAYPERAIDFIEREHLPGQILNTSLGAYLYWTAGRPVYSDSRSIPFVPQILRLSGLMRSSPSAWQREAERYNVTTLLVPLGERFRLREFCNNDVWAPVYLDEVSAIFIRRRAETEGLIKRLQIDCGILA
jgi:hypothetical protein